MKRVAILCALTALAGWGASANAADFQPPAIYDWTGFYIGGNVGYAFSGDDEVEFRNEEGNIRHVGDLELEGIFGGGQIGYDWQASSAVFGVVADVEAADINDDFRKSIVNDFDNGFIKGSDDIDVWGTVRARVGWAFDNVLVYATGGLAWADVDYKLDAANRPEFGEPLAGHAHDQQTRAGYTVGGGLEWGIDENWAIGAEYLYVNLGSYDVKGKVFDGDTGEFVGEHIETTATPDFHSVKAYVNYRF